MKNISIKHIAKLAGVSVATVSRVMNQNGGYSLETEKKVQTIIKDNHYTPNLVAKGLRTNKTSIIGIIVPDIANEFFAKLVLDIQIALFDYDYLTMVCNVNESASLEQKHIRALAAQNVSGIILISGTANYLDLQNIPTVYIDRKPKDEEHQKNIVIVESDNRLGGYLATKELINSGCKKIAFITDMMSESSKIGRYEGYCKAMLEAGISIDPLLIMRVATVSIDDAFGVTTQCFRDGLEFDGIVCTTDMIAIGAILAVKATGRKVPEDIKVTGFDNVSVASIFSPSITTIHQHGDKMAGVVAQLMMSLIEKKTIENMHHVIPVHLIKRQSTYCKNEDIDK